MVELETRFDSSRNMNGICFEDFDGDGSYTVTTPLIESGVEVNINEGGVTRYRGGWRLCVTPAGYLGGALWAAICTAVLDRHPLCIHNLVD